MEQNTYGLMEQSILKTIVYSDCLDRALTATEVYFYLAAVTTSETLHYAFVDVLKALERGSLLRARYIEEKNGYYFLKGRGHLYEERIERLKTADRLWKKMRRIARWIQMAPYVRLVMASGSLGMEHMTADSDLDVLVVMKRGRIWTGRFLLTALVHVLGVRRHGRYIAGRVCLNHYITDQSLHVPFHSLYNAMTYAQLVPIYERKSKKSAEEADSLGESSLVWNPRLSTDFQYSASGNDVKTLYKHRPDTVEARGVEPPDSWLIILDPHQAAPTVPPLYQEVRLSTTFFNSFQVANAWIRDYLPNWRPQGESLRSVEPNQTLVFLARAGEWCLDSVWGSLLEWILKRVQLRKIERRQETHAPGGRVRADDMMLEFHPNSPEKTIIDRFNKKMRELGVSLRDESDSGLA